MSTSRGRRASDTLAIRGKQPKAHGRSSRAKSFRPADSSLTFCMAVLQSPPPPPYGADVNHIIDCVYLGSAPPQRIHIEPGSSVCRYLTNDLNVGFVINVAAKTEPCVLSHVTYYAEFKVDDQNTDITARNLLRHLPQCLTILDAAKRDNKSVYIHCSAGLSRSPAIVLGLLMMRYGMSLKDAFHYLRARRPSIYPQPCYFRQLQQIEVRTLLSLRVLWLFSFTHYHRGQGATRAEGTDDERGGVRSVLCSVMPISPPSRHSHSNAPFASRLPSHQLRALLSKLRIYSVAKQVKIKRDSTQSASRTPARVVGKAVRLCMFCIQTRSAHGVMSSRAWPAAIMSSFVA